MVSLLEIWVFKKTLFVTLRQSPQSKWVCDLVSERVCSHTSVYVRVGVFGWVCVPCQLFFMPAIADHLLAGADTQKAPGKQPTF